jgi:hypothetical protein
MNAGEARNQPLFAKSSHGQPQNCHISSLHSQKSSKFAKNGEDIFHGLAIARSDPVLPRKAG